MVSCFENPQCGQVRTESAVTVFIGRDNVAMGVHSNVIWCAGGDMIPDPDMMIAVYAGRNVAEALTYQDTYIFTAVYGEEDLLVDECRTH